MVSLSKRKRQNVIVPESDKKLVQGLIDRNPDCVQTFINQYRELILHVFTTAHERMKIKDNLTSKMKERLFLALCENLHSSEDRQLKKFISGEKQQTLAAFLVVKAGFFCRDMFLVKGLKESDKEITERLFYGNDELSFQRIMKPALNCGDIRDYEKGGKRMSSIDFASDMYDQLMSRLNDDKFRFICPLHSYFASVVRTRLKEMIRDNKRNILFVDIDDYERRKDSIVLACVDYEREKVHEFYEGLFDLMALRGVPPKRVEVLRDWYLENLSAKEIGEKRGITANLVNQWVYKTKGELLKAFCEYDKL